MTYRVILADPPWRFEVWNKDTGNGRSAEKHYRTMTIDEICDLPVGTVCSDNCVLFMWCIWPMIFDAKRVIEAWGFQYRTKAFTWVKSLQRGTGFHFGMGYYTRANDEPCLLAVRGKMPVSAHDVSTIIYSPLREHSRKPEEQYEKIERLYPSGPYLELFARHPRDGWHVWGKEVMSDIDLHV